MTADLLERQMDAVARHIRICSDHQLSMVRILRGNVGLAAVVGASAMPGPCVPLVDFASMTDPSAPTFAGHTERSAPEIISTHSSAVDPFRELFAAAIQAPAGPFDEIIAAVATSPADRPRPVGPLPPRSRFMMRVAPVDRPARATKRNYDYFEELNAALAALANGDSRN